MTRRGFGAATLILLAAPAFADPIDLPAQDLAQALEALAAQTHSRILYSADLVQGRKAPALKGELSAEEALRRLLDGSGLEPRRTDESGFTVVRAAHSQTGLLDTVTVVATRTPNRTFDVPASVSTVTREQIQEAQAGNIGSVVDRLPNVTMQGASRVDGQIPTINGYYGPDIILQVDGARRSLDASVGVLTPLYVDPNFVKQVDVVRGPSSALFGGGGLGGVMSFKTIDAEDVLAPGDNVGGQAKEAIRTVDNSKSTNLLAAARYEGLSILAGATFTSFHGIGTGGDTYQSDQGGFQRNGLLKLAWAPDDDHRAVMSYTRFKKTGMTTGNPYFSPITTATFWQYGERVQDDLVGSYEFKDRDGLFDGKISGYNTQLKYSSVARSNNSVSEMRVNTTGGSAQNSNRFSAFDTAHRLTYGVDGYRDTLKNTSNGGTNGINPDGQMQAKGVFIQDEVSFLQDWTLIAALRYDDYTATATGRNTNSNGSTSPKVTLKWQALQALGFFTSYGEAFRAPTLTELYLSGRALVYFFPNPDLQPEVSRSKQAGMTLSFDDIVMKGDALRFKTTFFDDHVKNYITSIAFGGTTSGLTNTKYMNVPTAHRWGGDAELSYREGDWTLGLGASFVRAINTADSTTLYQPPDKLTSNLAYAVDEYWSVRWAGRFVAAERADAYEVRRRGGYSLHDIGSSYDRDWFRIDFGVSNLFDRAYRTYATATAITQQIGYAEGRSFNATLTARF